MIPMPIIMPHLHSKREDGASLDVVGMPMIRIIITDKFGNYEQIEVSLNELLGFSIFYHLNKENDRKEDEIFLKIRNKYGAIYEANIYPSNVCDNYVKLTFDEAKTVKYKFKAEIIKAINNNQKYIVIAELIDKIVNECLQNKSE